MLLTKQFTANINKKNTFLKICIVYLRIVYYVLSMFALILILKQAY